MAKYRKKPVVIEAEQFNGENYAEIVAFTKGNAVHQRKIGSSDDGGGGKQLYEKLTITTIHQGQKVDLVAGDFVIPEADGVHFYPCKPGVFANTYEKVEDSKDPYALLQKINDLYKDQRLVDLPTDLADELRNVLKQ